MCLFLGYKSLHKTTGYLPTFKLPEMNSVDSVGWLHLTDLHRGMTLQSILWPNVEQQFFQDIEVLHNKCGPWDVIFWSGDLVQKGASLEFEKFSETLSRLYQKLETLGSKPVLLTVPGNHDLARPHPSDPDVLRLRKWNEDNEVPREFWSTPRSNLRKVVRKAFQNYTNWEKAHTFPRPATIQRGKVPGDFAATVTVSGMKIGVLGLNSAFLQLTDGDYERKLAVSTEQLTHVCGEHFTDWFAAHQLCFLMTHHPPTWLSEPAAEALSGEIAIPGRFVAQLCGHLHKGALASRAFGGAVNQRIWQGASLFGLEVFADGLERQHGYSAGRINVVQGVGQIRLWPRAAQKHQAGHWHFVQDTTATLNSDGGTNPEECTVHQPTEVKEDKRKFTVLLLSTESDLREARASTAQYLRTSLGVEVDEVQKRPVGSYDLTVLIQAWQWEAGTPAKLWWEAPPSKRVAFFVEPNAAWPPYRLVEVAANAEICAFRASIQNASTFEKPDQIPELAGAVVTERFHRESGDTAKGVKDYERSYLEFRIPAWKSGRTALSQPHLFDPAGAKELYQPDLYTTLHGTCLDWQADKEGRPRKSPRKKRSARGGIGITEQNRRVRLAKWITVAEIPRIALIGAPGGGKTIFLTRIAAAIGSACLGRPAELEPDLEMEKLREGHRLPVPIVIEATRVAQRDVSSITALLSAIRDELASASTQRADLGEIEEGLKSGRYFLFVDALDEIADATLRSGVLQFLKGVSELFPVTRLLLTTRSARYTGQLRFGPELTSIEIAPLDERQVERLCGNWARHRQQDEEYRALLKAAVAGLADQAGASSSDQALTENPLMLTAICMVFERYRSLPDDRGRLCELLIDDLCRSRRSEDVARGWKLDEAAKKDLLQRIALAMQKDGAQAWPFDQAVEIAVQLVPKTDAARRERAKKYVDWAADHTGILRFIEAKGEQEQIRFWHRLFREYLCATRLAQEDTTVDKKIHALWGEGRLGDPFWEDVIRLLPRTLATIEKARSLREQLEALADGNAGQRGRLLGLSAAGVIENRDLFPDVNFRSAARSMASVFENQSESWSLSDRLLFLDALGRLDPADGDPRLHTEKWVQPKAEGAFVVHFDVRDKAIDVAFSWAPVAVQEYWQFVKSGAFWDDANWKDAPPQVLETRGSLSASAQSQMRHPNWPVVMVSLYAAIAYCRWKTSTRTDKKFVRLPDADEWRKFLSSSTEASQFAKGGEWPGGDKALFNWRGALVGHPSPVGAFALKVCDASDVLGNVWQWILPSKGDEPYELTDAPDNVVSCPVSGFAYNSGKSAIGIRRDFFAIPPAEYVITGYDSIGFRCVLSDEDPAPRSALSKIGTEIATRGGKPTRRSKPEA